MSRIPPAPPGNKKNSKQPPRPPIPPKSIVRPVAEEQNNQQQPQRSDQILSKPQQIQLTNEQFKPLFNNSSTVTPSIKNIPVEQTEPTPEEQTMFENREIIEKGNSQANTTAIQPPAIKKGLPPPTNKGPSKRAMGTPPPPSMKKQAKRSPPKDVAQVESKILINIPNSTKEEQQQEPLIEKTTPTPVQPTRIVAPKIAPPPFKNTNQQGTKGPSPQIKKPDHWRLQTKVVKEQQEQHPQKTAQTTLETKQKININKQKVPLPAPSKNLPSIQKNKAQSLPPTVKQYKPATTAKQADNAVQPKSKLTQKLQRLQKARELMKQAEQQEELDLQQQISDSQDSQDPQQQIHSQGITIETFEYQSVQKVFQQNKQERYREEVEEGPKQSVSFITYEQQQLTLVYENSQQQDNLDQPPPFQQVHASQTVPDIPKQQTNQLHNKFEQKQPPIAPPKQKIAVISQKKQNPEIHQLLQKYHSLKNVYLNNLRQLDELVHFQKQQEDHQVEKINHLLNQLAQKNQTLKNICAAKLPSQHQDEDQNDEEQNNMQNDAEEDFSV